MSAREDVLGVAKAMTGIVTACLRRPSVGDASAKLQEALIQAEAMRWALGLYEGPNSDTAEKVYGATLIRLDDARRAWVRAMDAALDELKRQRKEQTR